MRFRILVYAVIASGGVLRTSAKLRLFLFFFFIFLLLFKVQHSSADWSASDRPVWLGGSAAFFYDDLILAEWRAFFPSLFYCSKLHNLVTVCFGFLLLVLVVFVTFSTCGLSFISF